MTDKQINDINLRINRICFGKEFIDYFTEKFKFCPNGLTVDFYKDIGEGSNARYVFTPCIKIYGYEHASNNGVSEFTDASDFEYGDFTLTAEMRIHILKYFNNDEIIKNVFKIDDSFGTAEN